MYQILIIAKNKIEYKSMKVFYELISFVKDSKFRCMCVSMYTFTKKASHAYTCIHIYLHFVSFKMLFLKGFYK